MGVHHSESIISIRIIGDEEFALILMGDLAYLLGNMQLDCVNSTCVGSLLVVRPMIAPFPLSPIRGTKKTLIAPLFFRGLSVPDCDFNFRAIFFRRAIVWDRATAPPNHTLCYFMPLARPSPPLDPPLG